MSKESKIITVDVSERNEALAVRGSFGWEVVNTQEKEMGSSIDLTLQRETSIPNYATLCELEEDYDIIDVDKPIMLGILGKVALALVGLGGLMLLTGGGAAGLVFLLPGALILIWKLFLSYPKKRAKLAKALNDRAEIVRKAKALLQ